MFHSALDGKGCRDVFVNGYSIKHVKWANEEQGLVCFIPMPLQINKRKGEVYSRLLRGKVEVKPCLPSSK
ncbi:hypothetical protein G9F32_03115 [Acinetobacter sp. 194]|uniref:hypothetical protein n=1 Tax=Acinetobacter shaoyimingii TaxID=2715164 RepID=UPI00140733DE|nr:hypothetical protein [Acinetobacter shaoyimingii]NHB57023.1 hypothetical protein [Acinetobacter shaoyimingii]